MKAYGGVYVWLHSFLSSALDEGACPLDVEQESYNNAAPLHAMKAYGGVDAWLHSFLSSALDEGA
jgi:hypothetical protein